MANIPSLASQGIPTRRQHWTLGNDPQLDDMYLQTQNDMVDVLKHGTTLKQQLMSMRKDFHYLAKTFEPFKTPSPSRSSEMTPVMKQRTMETPPQQKPSPTTRIMMMKDTPVTSRKSRTSRKRLSVAAKIRDFNLEDDDDKENARVPVLGQSATDTNIESRSPYGTENLLKSRRRSHVTSRKALSPLQSFSMLNDDSRSEQKRHWCSLCKSKSCHHVNKSKVKSIRCPAPLPSTNRAHLPGNRLHLQSGTNRNRVIKSTWCSMCKTSECQHFPPPLVRTPCDGASCSPQTSTSSSVNGTDYENSVDLSTSQPNVLPIADLLLNKHKGQGHKGQSKVTVLGGFSLRGLDGTDLSLQSPMRPTRTSRHDATNINIHDISQINEKAAEQMTMSLRERTSNSNLTGALHSTLNYPLHSTLNNPTNSSILGMEAIPKDESSNWSTDSSEFSFDVDETPRCAPPRPQNPAVPRFDDDSVSVSYSVSDTCDSSFLSEFSYGRKEIHGGDDDLNDIRMKRQIGQRSLQDVKSSSTGFSESSMEDTLLADGSPSTCLSDFDTTMVPPVKPTTMILDDLYKKDTRQNEFDLDKTVQTGCIGLLKRQKRKDSIRKKATDITQENSHVLGLNCYGNALPVNPNILNSIRKSVNLTRSQSKRKHEAEAKSDMISEEDRNKRRCKRSATTCGHVTPTSHVTPRSHVTTSTHQVNPNPRRLSEVIRNTPGALHYELDSQLNVIGNCDKYPAINSDRRKALAKKMKHFNRTLQESGHVESLGHL